MSRFIDELKNVTKTPGQVQQEEEQKTRKKELEEEQELEKCMRASAHWFAECIRKDALGKASTGEYEIYSDGRIIYGEIEAKLDRWNNSMHKKLEEHYENPHVLPIEEQKNLHYISWQFMAQNLRYKKGYISHNDRRVDKYVLTPESKKILGMVRELLAEDGFEIGIKIMIEHREYRALMGDIFKTEEHKDVDEFTVKKDSDEIYHRKMYFYYKLSY